MSGITLLGFAAGALTTLSFLPQVLKTWRTKRAGDISLVTLSMFCTGVAGWLVYGLVLDDVPIIVANGVTLALALSVLVLSIVFQRKKTPGTAS